MKKLKWFAPIFLIFLGACSNPSDSKTVDVKPAEQEPTAQNGTPVPLKSPLIVTGLRVEPEVVDVYHPAVIIVSVNNTSKEYGVYNVDLYIDAQPFKTEVVALPGGASQNLTFSITPEQERNLYISVGDLVRELVIQHS